MSAVTSRRIPALSANLEGLVQSVVELALRHPQALELKQRRLDKRLLHFIERSPIDQRSTVTIDGDRGTGKTTVLLAAMETVASDPTVVVLPIIRPELFVENDSLFGRVIESLADYLHALNGDGYQKTLPGFEYTAAAEFDRIAQMEAAARRGTPTLGVTADGEDAATDALLTTRRSSEFDVLWRPFISAVLNILSAEHLIIPVDDADLAPEHLPELLADIRRLDDHPAVTCVVALNVVDLTDFLRGAILRSSSLSEDSFLRLNAIVSRQIEKALPLQNWVRLRRWEAADRLGFQPLDGSDPLERRLGEVVLGGMSLADRMRFASGEPTQFADALPSRPRPLQRLASELTRADPPRRIDAFLQALSEHVTESLQEASPPMPSPFEWRRGPAGIRGRLDITSWTFFSEMDPRGWRSFVSEAGDDPLSAEFELRIGRHLGTRAAPQGREESARVPDEATAAVLLVLDLEASRGFESIAVSGGRPVPGGENWRRPTIIINGEETDNTFLAPPRWESYFEYFLLNKHLTAITDELREVAPRDLASFTEWYAMSELLQIALLQQSPLDRRSHPTLRRTLDPGRASRLARDPSLWKRERGQVASRVLKAVATAYAEAVPKRNDRKAAAYVDWFESYFLGMAHPAILHGDLRARVIETWQRGTSSSGRGVASRARAREWLSSRLAAAGTATWADPIAELGEYLRLGPEFESHQRLAESEREALRHTRAGRVGQRAATALTDAADQLQAARLPRRDVLSVRRIARGYLDKSPPPVRRVDAQRIRLSLFEEILDQFASGRLTEQ